MELVGRELELGGVTGLIDRCRRSGVPGLASIVGEPGSGKTALLQAVRTSLRRLSVAAYLPEREIPFAAVAPALRRLAREPDGDGRLDGLIDDPSAPLALLEAAHWALQRRPTVFGLDDSQWADQRSRALLHYVLRGAVADRSTLVLLTASRTDASGMAFLDLLADLLPAEQRVDVRLGPLPRQDAVALARRLRPDLTPEDAQLLAARAKGSPYWVIDLARDGGRGPRSRIDRLGPDAAELLATLVVSSRPTPVSLLGAVLHWQESRLEAATDELVAGGIAVRRATQVAIAHDLLREEFGRSLPTSRAQAIHARFAAVLSAAPDATIGDLQLALLHRRRAGMDARVLALRMIDDPRGTQLGSEGLRHLLDELQDEPAEIQYRLGELALKLGEHATAQDRFQVAAEHATEPHRAAAASLRAAHAAYLRSDADGALSLLGRARSPAAEPASLVEADVLEAAVARWLLHDHARARRLTSRALETIPTDDGSDTWRRIRLAALNGAHDDVMIADDVPELVRIAQQRADLAVGIDERLETSAAVMNALLASGHLHEALASARELLGRAQDAGRPTSTLSALNGSARVLLELGRLGEAIEVAEQAAALEHRIGPRPGARRARTTKLAIELSTGDWVRTLAALAHNEEEEPDPHFRLSVVQYQIVGLTLFGAPGEPDVASLVARGVEYAEMAACPRCGAEFDAHVAEGWLRLGRADRAAEAWEGARRGLRDPWLEEHARRVDALLAAAHGRTSGRSQLLELADAAERRSWAYFAMLARLDLGRLLIRAGHDDAVRLLWTVREHAAAGRAANEAAVADRLLRTVGARTWRRGPATVPDTAAPLRSLTDRELEVARQVAEGATNPEIAETMFLSRKTIERHVSSIFVKLGVRNRTELAALVRELEPKVEGTPS